MALLVVRTSHKLVLVGLDVVLEGLVAREGRSYQYNHNNKAVAR